MCLESVVQEYVSSLSSFSGRHRKNVLMEVEVAAKDWKWLMWRPILIESKLSSGSVLIGLSLRNENVSLLRDRYSLSATYRAQLPFRWVAAAHAA